MSSADGGKSGALRSVLVVIGSVVAGAVVMFAVQSANYMLFPPPERLDYNDPEQLKQIVDAMPLAALWILELSYALGCLVAGVVAAAAVRGRRRNVPQESRSAPTGFTTLSDRTAPRVPTTRLVNALPEKPTPTHLGRALRGFECHSPYACSSASTTSFQCNRPGAPRNTAINEDGRAPSELHTAPAIAGPLFPVSADRIELSTRGFLMPKPRGVTPRRDNGKRRKDE